MRNRPFKKTQIIRKTVARAVTIASQWIFWIFTVTLSRSLTSEYPGYSLTSEPITAREKHYSLVVYVLTANSRWDEVEVTTAIFTEPEVTNCVSKIALVIIRENETKLLNLRLRNINKSGRHFENWKPSLPRHCYNRLAVIIARENEVLDQSARAIFDNHQCNFAKYPLSNPSSSTQCVEGNGVER